MAQICITPIGNTDSLYHAGSNPVGLYLLMNNSIEKKVKILDTFYRKNYISENNKSKIELFCTKCDNKLGNLISDDKGQRHCIDKNAIILNKLIK